MEVGFELYIKAIQDIDARRGHGLCCFSIDLLVGPTPASPRRASETRSAGAAGAAVGSWCRASQRHKRGSAAHVPRQAWTPRPGAQPGAWRAGCLFTFTGEVDNPMSLKDFPFDEDSLDFRLPVRMLDGRLTTPATLRPR